MFTGVIEKTGVVREWKRSKSARAKILGLSCPAGLARALKIGGSVCVNGACLTVVQKRGNHIYFNVVAETLKRTTLGSLKRGDSVHWELPLKANARLDGHFVLGHVDGKGKILRVLPGRNQTSLLVGFPKPLAPFFLEKGSVAVNGVSLTIGEVTRNAFWLHLIPYTLKKTRLAGLKKGDRVNLEADILVKLLARMFKKSFN